MEQNKVVMFGKYFGYPECCIKEFDDDFKAGIPSAMLRNVPANYTGFIPCKKHGDQIKAGEISIEELIKDRVCSVPFPEQLTVEESLNEIQNAARDSSKQL